MTAKPLMLPLLTLRSPCVKPTGASLKVKVSTADSSALRAVALLVMDKVGAAVSTRLARLLEVTVPAELLSCTEAV